MSTKITYKGGILNIQNDTGYETLAEIPLCHVVRISHTKKEIKFILNEFENGSSRSLTISGDSVSDLAVQAFLLDWRKQFSPLSQTTAAEFEPTAPPDDCSRLHIRR